MSDPYEFPDLSNGSCVGIDTEVFFPDSMLNLRYDDNYKAIKAMCASCPVFKQCLTYVLHVEVDGIWAGTGNFERRKIRTEMGIKAVKLQTQYTTDAMMSQAQDAIKARQRRAKRRTEQEQVA